MRSRMRSRTHNRHVQGELLSIWRVPPRRLRTWGASEQGPWWQTCAGFQGGAKDMAVNTVKTARTLKLARKGLGPSSPGRSGRFVLPSWLALWTLSTTAYA